jgi:hypothetical protein
MYTWGGVQQGDPLGPLLFWLVVHHVLTEVAELPDLTVEGFQEVHLVPGGWIRCRQECGLDQSRLALSTAQLPP